MDKKKSRLTRWLGSLGVFATSLAISVLLIELALRLFMPQAFTEATPGLFQPDPPRRYRLTPGHRGRVSNLAGFDTSVSINSAGLRGPEIGPKTPDTFRILVTGDSYTFGWGVEQDETFVARLADVLGSSYPHLEVMNAGVPGFGVQDEVDWLQEHGSALAPDLMILAIFAGNDLTDATEARRNEKISFEVPTAGPAKGFWLWLYRNSHLVRLADMAGFRKLLGLPDAWLIEYLRDVFRCYTDEPAPLAEEGKKASRKALEELKALSAERGVPVAAMIIPAPWQVDSESWKMTVAFLGMESEGLDPEAPIRFFRTSLEEIGIPVLDLAPTFRTKLQADGVPLYFSFDGHWNVDGHLVASEALGRFLLEEFSTAPEGGTAQSGDKLLSAASSGPGT